MNTTFINSETSKTSDTHRLLLSLTKKIDCFINTLPHQIVVFSLHEKILKNPLRTINSKFRLRHGMKN